MSLAGESQPCVDPSPQIPFGHPSLQPDTREWVHALIRDRLGYSTPQSWQVDGVVALLSGHDLFAIVRTGGGKSVLLQATMVATQVKVELAKDSHSQSKIKRRKGILCVPTKVIASRQAEAAKRCGIRAVAIHEDSLAAAKRAKPPRYLFREVVEGKWDAC